MTQERHNKFENYEIKTLCFNIHKGIGWRNNSTIDQIQTKLHQLNPDLIFLQEVRGHQFDLFKVGIWSHHSYGKNAVYQKGHHGNVILSRFPIIESDNIDLTMHRYESRGMLHAIALLPNQEKLHLLCLHLGLLAKDRLKQLDKIVAYIQKNIPGNERIIMGGDFNDWQGHATRYLITDLKMQESFLNMNKVYAKSYPAWLPVFRLDRIYFRGFEVIDAMKLTSKAWRRLSDHVALMASLRMYHE